MNKKQLYDTIANRKIKPKDFEPYDGNNGRVNKCAALIKAGRLRSGDVLIDIGGGIGDLGTSVSDLFSTTVTADISTTNLEAAKAKGNLTLRCDVDLDGINVEQMIGTEGWEWAKETPCADLITALDFIEHIIDPELFARECYRLLKSSGEVFINTPNIRYWKHMRSLVKDGRFPHTSGDAEVFHGGHLAFYTYSDMCTIFGKAGFTDFEMIKDEEGYENPPQWWLNQVTGGMSSQAHFVQMSLELGCPNLLFKCVK